MEHDWIPSTLGHGETMCRRCCITNREAAVLGQLNNCYTEKQENKMKKHFELVKDQHPVAHLANTISGMVELSTTMKMSKMDVCSALANACGHILADASKPAFGGKPLPREEALKRMDDLRKVMEGAYDLRNIKGEG